MKICILFLTCANSKEADKISKTLLEKKLIICAKKVPVTSSFLWKGKIGNANEVLLIMDSIEENFKKIKKEIVKLHSYESFVLFSSLVSQTTKEVRDWIEQELAKSAPKTTKNYPIVS